jgi:alanine-synthesizing transaminase
LELKTVFYHSLSLNNNGQKYLTLNMIHKSKKLQGICYDIRGPILDYAIELEEEGHKVIKLNIGNPAAFGFEASDEIIADVIHNIRNAQGYTSARGLFSARKAVMQECQRLEIPDIDIDDIYLGNGVSELIVMANQALLNDGDEVLIPSPDYPLWTAAANLAGGKTVYYLTRAIVIINPNNPTGAVYDHDMLQQLVQVARENNLVIFADEIYSKITYDEAEYIPIARLATDVVCLSFNGLSKSYRLAGFRSGWVVCSGPKNESKGFMEGLDMLASMRLCANVPAMFAIQTALGGHQSITELVLPGGRLKEQRDIAMATLDDIPGISCVKPKGAIYLFPRIDREMYKFDDDEQLMLNFVKEEHILLVQGTAFNWIDPSHFRIVFLPNAEEITHALQRFGNFMQRYRR